MDTVYHSLKQNCYICIVVSDDRGSEVRLWTVNASLVTKRVCDSSVHCLTFSNAPEGIAVNSLVAGCEDGVIRYVQRTISTGSIFS